MKLVAVASVVFLVGCAEAGTAGADESADASVDDDDVTTPDAGSSDAAAPTSDAPVITAGGDAAIPTIIDASTTPLSDASTIPDATPPPPPPPDAAIGGFCSENSDCPSPAECCYFLICVPGLEFGDLCFPE